MSRLLIPVLLAAALTPAGGAGAADPPATPVAKEPPPTAKTEAPDAARPTPETVPPAPQMIFRPGETISEDTAVPFPADI